MTGRARLRISAGPGRYVLRFLRAGPLRPEISAGPARRFTTLRLMLYLYQNQWSLNLDEVLCMSKRYFCSIIKIWSLKPIMHKILWIYKMFLWTISLIGMLVWKYSRLPQRLRAKLKRSTPHSLLITQLNIPQPLFTAFYPRLLTSNTWCLFQIFWSHFSFFS